MACSAKGFLPAGDARNKAKGDEIIFAEICAIQQLILDAINSCSTPSLSIVVNSQTPITSFNGINGYVLVDTGLGYIPGTATVDIPASTTLPIAGSGFVATATVDYTTGAITGFNVTDVGLNYSIGDVVTIVHPDHTGIPFVGEVSLVSTESSFSTDFSSDFTVQGSGATTVGDDIGEVMGINIIDPGTGYQDTPFLQLIDPNDTGYDFSSTITLNPVDDGILSIDILNNGRDYSVGTAAIVVGGIGGIGAREAIVTVQTEAGKYGVEVDAEYYYQVWSGLQDDALIDLQLSSVQQYFINLGYNFIIQVNPATMNTLQYYISW